MQEGKNLIDHHRVLDAGDNLYSTTAFTAGLDIDIENPHQSLCPGHGCARFGRRLVFQFIWRFNLVAFAPSGRRHQCTVLAVGSEHTVKSGQINPGPGYQCSEASHKVQRFEIG